MLKFTSRGLVRHASTSSSTTPRVVEQLQQVSKLVSKHSTTSSTPPLLDQTWLHRIDQAINDLERNRSANITIVGDRQSGVHKLTDSILDDPLLNEKSQEVTVALESRQVSNSNQREATTLQFGNEVEEGEGVLKLPAKWLKQHNTTITEILHGDVPLESSFTSLHLSDTVIVLLSSTTLLSSRSAQTILLNLHTKPNLIVCVDTTTTTTESSSSSILQTLKHQLNTLFPNSKNNTIMTISTEQALQALSTLVGTSSESTLNYQDFEKSYLTSQIPKLKSLLTKILSKHNDLTTTTRPSILQEETANYVLDSVLSRAAFSLATLSDTLTSARSTLSALSEQTNESSKRLLSSPAIGLDEKNGGMFPLPERELLYCKQSIQTVFDKRLQFYKLPFNKIDDISSELSLVISQTYLTDFEKHLLFSTGLFSSHSKELSKTLFLDLLNKPPFSNNHLLNSSVLENTISKSLHPSPNSPTFIPPTSLSTPISSRRSQLVNSPLSTLHRFTQKSLSKSLSFSLISIISAIGLNLIHAVELSNCFAVGVLGSTLAVWNFQKSWEKAKKKFWREFDRVSGGVSEDLGVVTKQLIERAEYPTRLAIKGYEAKIREKEVGLEELRKGLQEIARERRRGQEIGVGAEATANGQKEEVRKLE